MPELCDLHQLLRNYWLGSHHLPHLKPMKAQVRGGELLGKPKRRLQRRQDLVNLFLANLVRISGFSSLFSTIAVFLALSGKKC